MRTIRRLIYREMFQAVLFITLGFLALFAFFDFVDQLPNVSRGGKNSAYQIPQAGLYVASLLPNHLYELLPITVLIGTIYVMTRFAQSSEFTILRTSGLGPWRALSQLLLAGASLTLFTFVVGDYLAPWADKAGQVLKAIRRAREYWSVWRLAARAGCLFTIRGQCGLDDARRDPARCACL
jgi:lipopolysaccharide export system permease protein